MFCLFQSRYLPMRPEVLNGSGGLTQGDDGGASARQRRSQPAALSGIGAAFDRCGHYLNFILFNKWTVVTGVGRNQILGNQIGETTLICREGKSNDPSSGYTILFRSSQQLPHIHLVHCFQNHRDTRNTRKPSGVLR